MFVQRASGMLGSKLGLVNIDLGVTGLGTTRQAQVRRDDVRRDMVQSSKERYGMIRRVTASQGKDLG
jgi:hypothetical protein